MASSGIAMAVALVVMVAAAGGAWAADGGAGEAPLLSADFETDPLQSGWKHKAGANGSLSPAWTDAEAHGGKRCITAAEGSWESPAFPVMPFQFYRLEFFSKAAGLGYWSVFFYNEKGDALASDCYASVYESEGWIRNETCVRGRLNAVTARACFTPLDGKRLFIDDVSVRPMERRAAAEWTDALCATLPPLHYRPPKGRWQLIPKTMEKLRHGAKLRIVLLGDSIVNDTSNSPWDALLERAYPGAQIEVVISVRGGTGCQYYRQENRVKEYVFGYAPDLLVVGGISHGYDAEAIREVVRQVRAASGAEVLIMSGAVANAERCRAEFVKHSGLPAEKAEEKVAAFPERIKAVAAEEKCEFLDMRAIWDEYMKGAAKPEEWFRRDIIHANDRGKQILGRVLERFFTP
ncbi:MAG: SGNH/GDSL hydrolase family protein [Planctomycetota bacterium]|nr:SGNH/GDSL hydrolase family protein [Planctomycetota bacterium]